MSRAYAVVAYASSSRSLPPASAQTNLGRLVAVEVTLVAPQEVFELLARELDCTITVDPAVRKPLTLRVVTCRSPTSSA
jgi:hypothetical protein